MSPFVSRHHADYEKIAIEAIRVSEMSQMVSSYAKELQVMGTPKPVVVALAGVAMVLANLSGKRAEEVSQAFGNDQEIAAVRAAGYAAQQAHWDAKDIDRYWKKGEDAA